MNRNFKALYGGGCPATDYYVKVQGCGRERFELALALAFNDREAKYWTVCDSHGLIFLWYLPPEELGVNHSILKVSETYWEPTYIHHETKEYLYTLKNREWEHDIKYIEFSEPQCVGQCLDIAWNWLTKEAVYPNKPQFDIYQDDYNGCSLTVTEDDEEYRKPIPGFEIGTHLDRFRSIHHCDGALCYIKPSWLREY